MSIDPRHVILDFSPDDQHDYLAKMHELLTKLAAGWEPEPQPLQEFTMLSEVSVADARRIGLPEEMDNFVPFAPADRPKLAALGLPASAAPLSWSYSKYGRLTRYMGEVVQPV